MAVLTFANLQNLAFDRAQVNVTTDAPVSATEFARFVNEAYADVWAISGGRFKLGCDYERLYWRWWRLSKWRCGLCAQSHCGDNL